MCASQTKIRQDGVAGDFRHVAKWAVRFETKSLGKRKPNLSGASIALNFNRTKRMESYKNEKSNIF